MLISELLKGSNVRARKVEPAYQMIQGNVGSGAITVQGAKGMFKTSDVAKVKGSTGIRTYLDLDISSSDNLAGLKETLSSKDYARNTSVSAGEPSPLRKAVNALAALDIKNTKEDILNVSKQVVDLYNKSLANRGRKKV